MQFELSGLGLGKRGISAPERRPPEGALLRGTLEAEIGRAPFSFEGSETGHFVSLCRHYSEKLRTGMPKVSEGKRKAAIRAVNMRQAAELRALKGEHIDFDKDTRRLNLYFRTGSDGRTQMDPFEFGIMVWILDWYVHQGHSRVFNQLSVVSRLENDYPHFIHTFSPRTRYLNVRGEEFQRACAVGANTMHLTHGSVIENQYASIPIIGQSTREDSVAMQNCREYVPLRLYYPEGQRPNARDIELGETDYSGSFEGIMNETIRAVRQLEDTMLAGDVRSASSKREN